MSTSNSASNRWQPEPPVIGERAAILHDLDGASRRGCPMQAGKVSIATSPCSTATPFDSGGCETNHCLRNGEELDERQRAELLARFWLDDGTRVAEYGSAYIADIFDDPRDYVRRAQISDPDRLPVHGLSSRGGDRRAWTIEVQIHGDVPLPPERLSKIVLRRREQVRELPQPYRRLAVVPDIGDFSQAIAQEVLE